MIHGFLQVIESPLYDTLSIPLGFASEDTAFLFVNPLGSMGYNDPLTGEHRVKSFTETNMLQSGQLPAPEIFNVRSIRAALFNRKGELLPVGARHYRGVILELRLLDKPYWKGPLWRAADPATFFSSGNPLASFNSDERTAIIQSLRCPLTNLAPDIPGYPPIESITGVLIDKQQPFSVMARFDPSFEWHDLRSPGSLVVLLEGTHGRTSV